MVLDEREVRWKNEEFFHLAHSGSASEAGRPPKTITNPKAICGRITCVAARALATVYLYRLKKA